MPIRKSPPANTLVETAVLQRADLSFTAKGIYAYYCSLPVGTTMQESDLYTMPGRGAMSSVYSAGLQELLDAGVLFDDGALSDDGK